MPAGPGDHDALIRVSARFRSLFRVLDEVREADQRVLIFVDLRRAQRLLQELVRHRFGLRNPPDVINGETDPDETRRIKTRFQEGRGFEVLLLGPKAAGFGLNLTAANHVVHLSRWWNPAVEDQCSDRVYRIGQDREVTIHIPRAIHPRLGEASFDMVLDGLLASKRALSREIVVPTTLTSRDHQDMLARVTAQAGTGAPKQGPEHGAGEGDRTTPAPGGPPVYRGSRVDGAIGPALACGR
jgi:Helicase conserved C-terminal domain